MDDILTGADTLETAVELQRRLTNLCMAGGFPLRKWSANDEVLLRDVPAEHRMQREFHAWHSNETHVTFGILWHPGTDVFSFAVKAIPLAVITKRSVLFFSARLFDPLDWLAPVVVSAKIAFQATWLKGMDWDNSLDDSAAQQWKNYYAELPLLERIRIPRRIYPEAPWSSAKIHSYADASERAYAAVIYLRTRLADGTWQVVLVTARIKVAPIKPVALSRLELCAATLLARLASHVQTVLRLREAPLHFWSDSTIALGWIKDYPFCWKIYVANRVAEIQTTIPAAIRHHILSPRESR